MDTSGTFENRNSICLQLPNLSCENFDKRKSFSTWDLDMDSIDYEDELFAYRPSSNPNSFSENKIQDLYEILKELPSLKYAAWARRKAVITAAATINTDKNSAGSSGESVRNSAPIHKKETFTRKCCSQTSKKRKGAEVPSSSSTSSSVRVRTSLSVDSFQSFNASNTVSKTKLDMEHVDVSSHRRELVKMHPINLYQAILPPSFFMISKGNYKTHQ